MRFLAVQLLNNPLVPLSVPLPDRSSDSSRTLVYCWIMAESSEANWSKATRLLVVRPLELNALFQRLRVVVVDGEPDVVGERQQVLPDRFQVFENLPRAACAEPGLTGIIHPPQGLVPNDTSRRS